MQRRKIRDERDARACLKKVEESGMERTRAIGLMSMTPLWRSMITSKMRRCDVCLASCNRAESDAVCTRFCGGFADRSRRWRRSAGDESTRMSPALVTARRTASSGRPRGSYSRRCRDTACLLGRFPRYTADRSDNSNSTCKSAAA